GQGEFVFFDINASDFSTAQRVAEAINKLKPGAASAIDGRQLKVRVPVDPHRRVDFLSQVENLEVQLAQGAAKVIVNSRTGSVVMTQLVTLEPCAVAHGNLSVSVSAANTASQPGALSGGKTEPLTNAQVEIQQEPGILKKLSGAKLSDIVNTLNAMGANPQDLIAILQAMKTAGALRAELEII
ncbi:MAG: flagellar basal body P-ring protein FlgI, partial [Rhodocyclaceae bacterium]|nr:flagellar basal body P-ring protein FlgI [Rhodocyclaceae bacterium]